jgi:YidC/Oxa1 family membrane protein insertase
MLANILQPLIDVNESILQFFHDKLGFSWGLAIIGLTVVIRLAILPLTFKQVRSMQALQRLQPEIKKLQERYKDDKQRMQQEMMGFYKENSVNPLGSCLPLVLQLPFFMSLFYLQRSDRFKNEVRVNGEQAFLFIKDITQPATGGVLIALIVIYIATQLGSSHVSAMVATDKNQKRLLYALPFVFVPFVVQFPAGLLVYWITTNVWTIGQQLVIRKLMPPPHLAEHKPATDDKKKKPGKLATAAALADGSTKGGGRSSSRAPSDGKPSGGKASGGKASGGKASGGKAGGDRASSGGRASGQTAKRPPKPKAEGQQAKGSSNGGGSGGGNVRSGGPPPSSPRKKKKRSGRRR